MTDERDVTAALAEVTRERDELRRDAEITRTIRRSRGGCTPGIGCCCEFDTEDGETLVQECIVHAEVRRARDAALAEFDALEKLARALASAEWRYRCMYQSHGGDSLEAGRAWDRMKRAGNAVRMHFSFPMEPGE